MVTGIRAKAPDLSIAHCSPEIRDSELHFKFRNVWRRFRPRPTSVPAPAPRVLTPVETLDRTLDDPEAKVEDVLLGFVIAAVNDYAAAEDRLIKFDFG